MEKIKLSHKNLLILKDMAEIIDKTARIIDDSEKTDIVKYQMIKELFNVYNDMWGREK